MALQRLKNSRDVWRERFRDRQDRSLKRRGKLSFTRRELQRIKDSGFIERDPDDVYGEVGVMLTEDGKSVLCDLLAVGKSPQPPDPSQQALRRLFDLGLIALTEDGQVVSEYLATLVGTRRFVGLESRPPPDSLGRGFYP